MKLNSKVYVSNWMQIYSTFRKWNIEKQIMETVFPWKTKLPEYINQSNDTVVYVPKLTQKGLPFKDGSKIEVSREQTHKSYEYTIREMLQHPNDSETTICLISSNHADDDWNKVWAQIDIKALTTLTIEEQESLKHLQKEKYLQALAKNNLGKWKLGDNLKDFPKELLQIFYDEDQKVLFGSFMTGGVVTYNIIPREYTVDNVALYFSSSVLYNGEGCDLSNKSTITWEKLSKMCSNQKFH